MVEKYLKLDPYDQNRAVYILLLLVLLLVKTYPVLEEKYDKKNLVSPPSFSDSKVVYTLLIEVVALHIGLSAIHVWRTGFQRFIKKLLGGSRSLSF